MTNAAPPILQTARLTLRPHVLPDFPDTAALWADPEVVRFIGGRPLTREESWTRFLRYVGHWTALGFGYWTVRDTASGRFVGEVGFGDYKRDLDPPLEGVPEAGWVLAAWAAGRGYATEAVTAALAWGDAALGGPHTACIIRPDHVASIRVAGKVGFVETHRAPYKGEPIVVMTRRRPV